jgi:hypothetical protein
MAQRDSLTTWQKRHKNLFEEALLNPDLNQELGYLRRDTNSPLQTNEPQSSLDDRLLRLMDKFNIQPECFEVLKKFCRVGGDLDFTLITPLRRLPNARIYAKRDQEAYSMHLQQGKSITQITAHIRSKGFDVDVQYVSKIIKRMNAKDPNKSKNARPPGGHRTSRQK